MSPQEPWAGQDRLQELTNTSVSARLQARMWGAGGKTSSARVALGRRSEPLQEKLVGEVLGLECVWSQLGLSFPIFPKPH